MTASGKAADTGGCVRNPGEIADVLDIKPPGIVEILRQPEQAEEPGGVAQKFSAHHAENAAGR
jgi:hypothetical protein